MFSKALISAAVAMSATANAFQQNNFANNQCGMKCCGGMDKNMDHGDSMDSEIPDSLKEFADNFDNEKCGMFCQMQTAFNDTLNAAMGGSSCEDDCCRMPPAKEDQCCSGGTCCAPPTSTMSSSAQMDPLPQDFEFEQCGMMCQLNNTISDFASQAFNGTAADAMAVSDSSDSDL